MLSLCREALIPQGSPRGDPCVAILISILLPTLNKVRQAAVALKCNANLRTCRQAIAMYEDEYKVGMPYVNTGLNEGVMWFVAIEPAGILI